MRWSLTVVAVFLTLSVMASASPAYAEKHGIAQFSGHHVKRSQFRAPAGDKSEPHGRALQKRLSFGAAKNLFKASAEESKVAKNLPPPRVNPVPETNALHNQVPHGAGGEIPMTNHQLHTPYGHVFNSIDARFAAQNEQNIRMSIEIAQMKALQGMTAKEGSGLLAGEQVAAAQKKSHLLRNVGIGVATVGGGYLLWRHATDTKPQTLDGQPPPNQMMPGSDPTAAAATSAATAAGGAGGPTAQPTQQQTQLVSMGKSPFTGGEMAMDPTSGLLVDTTYNVQLDSSGCPVGMQTQCAQALQKAKAQPASAAGASAAAGGGGGVGTGVGTGAGTISDASTGAGYGLSSASGVGDGIGADARGYTGQGAVGSGLAGGSYGGTTSGSGGYGGNAGGSGGGYGGGGGGGGGSVGGDSSSVVNQGNTYNANQGSTYNNQGITSQTNNQGTANYSKQKRSLPTTADHRLVRRISLDPSEFIKEVAKQGDNIVPSIEKTQPVTQQAANPLVHVPITIVVHPPPNSQPLAQPVIRPGSFVDSTHLMPPGQFPPSIEPPLRHPGNQPPTLNIPQGSPVIDARKTFQSNQPNGNTFLGSTGGHPPPNAGGHPPPNAGGPFSHNEPPHQIPPGYAGGQYHNPGQRPPSYPGGQYHNFGPSNMDESEAKWLENYASKLDKGTKEMMTLEQAEELVQAKAKILIDEVEKDPIAKKYFQKVNEDIKAGKVPQGMQKKSFFQNHKKAIIITFAVLAIAGSLFYYSMKNARIPGTTPDNPYGFKNSGYCSASTGQPIAQDVKGQFWDVSSFAKVSQAELSECPGGGMDGGMGGGMGEGMGGDMGEGMGGGMGEDTGSGLADSLRYDTEGFEDELGSSGRGRRGGYGSGLGKSGYGGEDLDGGFGRGSGGGSGGGGGLGLTKRSIKSPQDAGRNMVSSP
ncbi:hypothetical protein ACQY0O_004258 [Thecaphora frezii]